MSPQAIYTGLLNYRVTGPPRVAACVSVLHKIMANVVEHPLEEKYRQVFPNVNSMWLGRRSLAETICKLSKVQSNDWKLIDAYG